MTDDSGVLTMEVPTAWTDVVGSPAPFRDGLNVPALVASPNVDGFLSTWETPGAMLLATPELGTDLEALLADMAPEGCTEGGREAYDDGAYQGVHAVWTDCGGTATTMHTVAATAATGTTTVVVAVQEVSAGDADVVARVLGSFQAG